MMPMLEPLTNLVLALDHPDWTIPWAGLGGFLLGLGSTLSGVAALRSARKKGRDEGSASTSSGPGNGGGERVSDGDSVQSG